MRVSRVIRGIGAHRRAKIERKGAEFKTYGGGELLSDDLRINSLILRGSQLSKSLSVSRVELADLVDLEELVEVVSAERGFSEVGRKSRVKLGNGTSELSSSRANRGIGRAAEDGVNLTKEVITQFLLRSDSIGVAFSESLLSTSIRKNLVQDRSIGEEILTASTTREGSIAPLVDLGTNRADGHSLLKSHQHYDSFSLSIIGSCY